MNKHINKFNTVSEYFSNRDTLTPPSVSYIKPINEVRYGCEYTIDKERALPGWIAYKPNDVVIYYNPKSPEVSNFDISKVVGIVVIPADHTEDGTVRIVSIDYMNVTTPSTGDSTATSMYWGYNGAEVANLTSVNNVVTYVSGTTTTSLASNGKFVTDWDISQISNISDDQIANSNNNENYKYISKYFISGPNIWQTYSDVPCPYNTDYTKNIDYISTTGSILTQGLCGKQNTNKIIAVVSHDGDITNANTTGYYPAAECCKAYKDGSWYLPSIAELGYLVANLKEIEYTRNLLNLDTLIGRYYWSSSQYSSNLAWYVNLYLNYNFGGCFSNPKGSNYCVLAFVAL